MKKIYTFFALLLLCSVTAVAQTTVYIANGTNDPNGYLCEKSGTSFTSKAASGLAGVVVSNLATTDQGTWNSIRYLTIKPSAGNTAERITITAPDGYVITGYTLNCCNYSSYSPYYVDTSDEYSESTRTAITTYPGSSTISASGLDTNTTGFWIYTTNNSPNWLMVSSFAVTLEMSSTSIQVTYEVYESDGTTLAKSTTVPQERNSAVNIPSELTTDSWYYDYSFTDGTIGETDCTIKYTRTLKNGIVTDLANLSNTKAYSIQCKRGYLSTYNGKIASTFYSEATLSSKNFAIISYENAYYLYSVEDAMFVQQDGTLGTYPNGSTVSFSATTSPLYQIKFGTNFLNVNYQNYGWVINTYSTPDDGNQFVIIEAGDFDPTNALEKFADRTPYYEALNAMITKAESMPFGTTLHTYVKSADFDNDLATAQTTYANEDATIEEPQPHKPSQRPLMPAK